MCYLLNEVLAAGWSLGGATLDVTGRWFVYIMSNAEILLKLDFNSLKDELNRAQSRSCKPLRLVGDLLRAGRPASRRMAASCDPNSGFILI